MSLPSICIVLYVSLILNHLMWNHRTVFMQPEVLECTLQAIHLVHSELLFRANKRDLQEKLHQTYDVDIIISANFNTTLHV